MLRLAQCPDCDSDVTIAELSPDVYEATVAHDDTCPWFTAFRGIRRGTP
jgi:hypothetical protein